MGQKKGVPQNDWCVYRSKDYGELYDHNVIKNPLPPVGSYVTIRRAEVHPRGKGEHKDIKISHPFDDNYLDGHKRPLVFKVMEYKLGIDKPLARGNAVRLVATTKGGYTYPPVTLGTILCCNGYYLLDVQEDNVQRYSVTDVYNVSSDELPIGELTYSARKKKEKELKEKELKEPDKQDEQKKGRKQPSKKQKKEGSGAK